MSELSIYGDSEPQLPPFLFTYWKPFSKDSHLLHSWFDYVKDVTVAQYAAESVGKYVQQTSAAQIDALYTVGNAICGQVSELQHGIAGVQQGILPNFKKFGLDIPESDWGVCPKCGASQQVFKGVRDHQCNWCDSSQPYESYELAKKAWSQSG